jgi:hypothetical protein
MRLIVRHLFNNANSKEREIDRYFDDSHEKQKTCFVNRLREIKRSTIKVINHK